MDKGLVGGYGTMTTVRGEKWHGASPHNPLNRNCLFVIQSGSMAATGRTELLAELFGILYNMDGAESADVYANNDGRIHYLGNIKSRHPYGQDLWSIPYGGGEGWTNTKTLAGFIETYNHTFIFDDSDSMPELLHSISEIVDESKINDYTGILIRSGLEEKEITRNLKRANELDQTLAPFAPFITYRDNPDLWLGGVGMEILNAKMEWLAHNRDE